MNYANMIQLPSGTLRRRDIEKAASSLEGFRPTQLRNLIAILLKRGTIERIGRDTYVRSDIKRRPYQPLPSPDVETASNVMEASLPLLGCRVWALSDMNEFLNHQVASAIVLVQVEADGIDFAFESMRDSLGDRASVLLRPSADDIARYGGNVTVAVTRLVSEAPPASDLKRAISLEQMAVDLFADKLLASMLSKADYPAALEEMFEKYAINEGALFRYARRRGKEEELVTFLKEQTNISLHRKDRE